MSNLERDIVYLKGVGRRRAEQFKKLGVTTVNALLHYYPKGYLDYRTAVLPEQTVIGEKQAVRAEVVRRSPATRISGGRMMYRVLAAGDTSDLELVWFNNKYAPAALKEGTEYIFYGTVGGTMLRREMINPTVVSASEQGSLVPQYPLTAGLSSRIISNAVRCALEATEGEIKESLPEDVLKRQNLVGLAQALHDIHFPPSNEQAQRARARLAFEELLCLSLGLELLRGRTRERTAAVIDCSALDEFIGSLPFALTSAQQRSIDEIAADISKNVPMNRLLQGDVGSGKTVCAAAAAFCAAKSGWQSAVMAPTEILAAQHAETFRRLLQPFGINVRLLTGSVKGAERRQILAEIADGNADLVIGTHALISGDVRYKKLGLVVADEQHRFGVRQRSALAEKGERPHLLVMSATPIPRTLALIMYRDLDISLLDELPPGRKPVKTRVLDSTLLDRCMGFVRKTALEGGQAYIVCPLVENDDEQQSNLRSATAYRDELAGSSLAGIKIGLLHGRMKPAEKERVMAQFAAGETKVLVSTTVIEVGVDVPNASVMIIENAERFGLSTLHQLRGRVGRGEKESWCFLISDSTAQTARERLETMRRTNDGFEIARQDLKTRGPGDFLGSRQHGLPALGAASLAADEKIVYAAAQEAQQIEALDPELKLPQHRALKDEMIAMFSASETALN